MSSCTFEELVAGIAAMLKERAPQDDIDQLLERLSPAYRAEVLAAARDLLAHHRARQP
jgi:hypothetical protein